MNTGQADIHFRRRRDEVTLHFICTELHQHESVPQGFSWTLGSYTHL